MAHSTMRLISDVSMEMERRGFAVFHGIESINLVGLRSSGRTAGDFDDRLLCWWMSPSEDVIGRVWRCTTDPGARSLGKPANPAGCAILLPGQYRGAYRLGKHRGRYRALVQTGGPVRVARDNDGDEVLDIEQLIQADHVGEGFFGINIHASSRDPFDPKWDRKRLDGVDAVGAWSQGCQVLADSREYRDEFWPACEMTAKRYGPSVTYTLLDWPG